MPLINSGHMIFASEAAAKAVADRCQTDDNGSGWIYLVRTNETNGRAVIEIYDETGHLLGKL